MSSLAVSPMAVRFDEYSMWVDLSDGRVLGVPLAWFPRLFEATAGPARAGQAEPTRIALGEPG